MKTFLGIVMTLALLFAAASILCLAMGVWLPDVLYAPRQTLAVQRTPGGHTFRVIQYWNRVDFYNTELIHVFPNGKVEIQVLDGDDSKTWQVPLSIDEQKRTATVTLKHGRVRTMTW